MRRFIIGLIVGVALTLSTSAFAAIGDAVQATFSSFTFMVNGDTKTLDADPLVYQGSAYLPVRTVANLLGYDVTYKADSRTIEFDGSLPEASSEPATSPETSPEPSTAPKDGTTPTESPSGSGEPTTSPEPSGSPEPSTSPEPSPEPTPDNTAACQAIRDSHVMALLEFDRNHNPFNGRTSLLRSQLLDQQSAELENAGC